MSFGDAITDLRRFSNSEAALCRAPLGIRLMTDLTGWRRMKAGGSALPETVACGAEGVERPVINALVAPGSRPVPGQGG